jgi:DNA-directed RNA polymerase specialized sigma24 family protein
LTFPARNPDVVIPAGARRLTSGTHLAHSARPLDLAAPPEGPNIDDLLHRMQAGDRSAAAIFLRRYETRIRRRIRGKLGSDVRRLFDSLDIVSTIGRRLDLYVMSGHLHASNETQCLNLLFKMADRALIDKARIFRQMEAVEGEDSEFAQQLASRLRAAELRQKSGVDDEIEDCMDTLRDPIDRRIFSLWLTGERHADIGELVRLPSTAVRKRWEYIKSALRARFVPASA